jgi:hypothetical protein
MLGNVAEAVEQLDAILSIPSTTSIAWIEADPRWDAVRGTPEFEALRDKHAHEDPN